MSTLNFEPKRLGRFSISHELVAEMEPAVGAFLRECFVRSAQLDIRRGVVEYLAHHPQFDPCDTVSLAPRYVAKLEKTPEQAVYVGAGEWETRVRYTWTVQRASDYEQAMAAHIDQQVARARAASPAEVEEVKPYLTLRNDPRPGASEYWLASLGDTVYGHARRADRAEHAAAVRLAAAGWKPGMGDQAAKELVWPGGDADTEEQP